MEWPYRRVTWGISEPIPVTPTMIFTRPDPEIWHDTTECALMMLAAAITKMTP